MNPVLRRSANVPGSRVTVETGKRADMLPSADVPGVFPTRIGLLPALSEDATSTDRFQRGH